MPKAQALERKNGAKSSSSGGEKWCHKLKLLSGRMVLKAQAQKRKNGSKSSSSGEEKLCQKL